jgi:signal transduction histidine kinase/DNA-binding response OmpR family regulator
MSRVEQPRRISPEPMDPLQGGGEMGALMRSIDWSTTPVGPVDAWPSSLRTVVSILLASQHPIFVWWGKEMVQFYNDGYRPILGSKKHPAAMGQCGRDCWREIWDVIEPMIETVFAGGSTYLRDGQLILERNGYPEECYFDYAYSPVRDETGGVTGVFVACTETTGRVLGERRLKLLGELGTNASNAKSPAAACRAAQEVLAQAQADVPFALIYLAGEPGTTARLAGAVGLPAGHRALVDAVELAGSAGAGWPLDQAAQRDVEIDLERLAARVGPLPGGVWPEPAARALVLPLARGTEDDLPAGFLVAGVSPRLPLDDAYRSFLRQAAGHIAAAVRNGRAYEEEKRRAEALAALDRAKTAFFSNVSHELRTPLTLILGPVEDSLEDTAEPLLPRQRERQQTVHRNATRLLKLVNTLLDFSRIEAGRAQARYEPIDLAAFTAELASTFRSLVEKAGLSLTVHCPAAAVPVYVDRVMYEKITLNLLSNAFKFTFEGEIRVSLELDDTRARLVVADTGTGIPEAELPRIFERFHRIEGTRRRSYEGSGIGLALVQELVRLHGGAIWVESAPGRGSRFTVVFPLGKAHLPAEQVVDRAVTAATASGATPFVEEAVAWLSRDPALSTSLVGAALPEARGVVAARVLVADDNADMREYLHRLLTGRGWTVEVVADGEAALRVARRRRPDLVLADVMMPGLDGFALMRALRADPATADVPVVLLSARAGEDARVEGLDAGADDYLVKPFSAKELVSCLAARLEVARAHAEAREARSRLHAQLMQAPMAVCVLRGPQLVYELANPRYLEMVGRTSEQVLGTPVRRVFPELPGDAPVFRMLEEVYRTGVPRTIDEYSENEDGVSEYRVPLDRGTGRVEDAYFLFTCQPVRDGRGQVTEIMMVAVDVTDQVLARQRVEALLGELRAADERKDEFLAMLAHELRNPLAAISMALALIERCHDDPVRAARHRQLARRQMDNLVRLVDDLLDVSRITRGKVELREEEVDLAAVVQAAVAATGHVMEARGHSLSVTVGAGPYRLRADSTRLEQVVVNLLTNAAKYTDPGGRISLRLSRQDLGSTACAVLSVRDSGRGIPAGMLDSVFDMFVQVSPTLDRNIGGLGLGLTLVKKLVEMHGGAVEASSEGPDRGSEFVIRLPLPPVPGARAEVRDGESAGVPAAQDGCRVLLVEDSPDLRAGLGEFLEALGHEVTVAADGVEGSAKLQALRPDVALVDVGLPGIDGYKVARRARAQPGGDALFLVALTGYGGPEAQARAQSAGFDLHLTKPVNTVELGRIVTHARRRGADSAG